MNIRHFFIVATCAVGLLRYGSAQITQIDQTKLPQNPAVLSAYLELLPLDQYARTYEMTWRFPVPKKDLAARFTLALHTLEEARKETPGNRELQLLTGLVAHLAYNLDAEEAYEPAMSLLSSLARDAGTDFRPAWFLGMQQCQSNDTVGGMNNLLLVEASPRELPRAFWQDYANCAGVSFMPAHAIRAYDNADRISGGPPTDLALERIARNRISPSDVAASYPVKTVWAFSQTNELVRFTSTLCGESFATRPETHLNLSDVKQAKCVVTIQTDPYPNRHKGNSSATLLLLTMPPAASGESLGEFADGFLKDGKYADRKEVSGVPCPVPHCLAYEIRSDAMYTEEGGGHLLAVFFSSQEPPYPGLRFEEPKALPKSDPSDKSNSPTFYRPDETLRRFSGTLYTIAVLDANDDIYEMARPQFNDLLKSLVVDTK